MTFGNLSDEAKALKMIENDRKAALALLSCAPCGMTTVELAGIWFAAENPPQEATEKTIYNILNRLSSSKHGIPPILDRSSMSISGRGGAKKVYRLTQFGYEVLQKIAPDTSIRYLNEPTEVMLRHRFCQQEVYTLARKQGWDAEIEKVIPYGNGSRNVRCDVVLNAPDGPLYVEVEQKLAPASAPRARQKIDNWTRYMFETGEAPRVILFFNLSASETEKTIGYWRDALWMAKQSEAVKFEMSYLLMSNLRRLGSLQEDMQTFTASLHPLAPVKEGTIKAEETWQPPVVVQPLIDRLDKTLFEQMEIKRYRQAEDLGHSPDLDSGDFGYEDYSGDNVAYLMVAAKHIYDASSNARGTFTPPMRSLWLMRYYLTHEYNRELYSSLRERLGELANKNVTQYKIGMHRVIWDVIMRHFYIGMEGSLQIYATVPDYLENESNYGVKIVFSDFNKFRDKFDLKDEHLLALEWMLESIFNYQEDLGLTLPCRTVL